jgi:N-acetylglucosamine-6-phosphate deacetylase
MTLSQTGTANGWITPLGGVFDGQQLQQNASVHIHDGMIDQIAPLHPTAQAIEGVLSPGFFDLQVNGGGGILFNTTPTPRGIAQIALAHYNHGTSDLLPTVITDTPQVLENACHAIADAIDQAGIAGIHIEGPHISREKAGVHRKSDIRPFDDHTERLLRSMRDRYIPVLITVAPEGILPAQVSTLTEMGVVVALGHSNASASAVVGCIEAGASLFTHLYNAMSPMTSREPGMVGTAINSAVYCSMICDGRHVAPEMIRLAINARPRDDRMIIVSDAMPTVGGKPTYELYGETVELHEGKLVNEAGALAGAHITMAESISFLQQQLKVSLERCLQMAITHPWALLQQPQRSALLQRPVSGCVIVPANAALTTPLANHLPTR